MTDTRIHRILYIEDNQANRQLVQLILGRKTHLVLTTAADGRSGIETAKTILPDLVLLDISLPDMSGFSVLAALRDDPATAQIPVVAISGEFPPRPPADSRYTFERYLPKPIELTTLYQAIDDALHSAG